MGPERVVAEVGVVALVALDVLGVLVAAAELCEALARKRP